MKNNTKNIHPEANMPTKHNFLKGIKVYLSGPMDFVFSRAKE